jgi:SAM-dependent methyltransferase
MQNKKNELGNIGDSTIRDFGIQWQAFSRIDAWSISDELFTSITPPFVSSEDLKGKKIAEIGAGSGNMTLQLLSASPRQLIAVEPSKAMHVLKNNTAEYSEHMLYIYDTGENLPSDLDLDWIFSIGVIHHIPDPGPTIKAAYNALRSGGEILLWLYGKEGNELYLSIMEPIRRLTKKMSHKKLNLLTYLILPLTYLYMYLCKIFPLPLNSYVKNVLCHMSAHGVRLVIYDQLNPHFAKYYTKAEAESLLQNAGFIELKLHQRLGYSWTVYGRKPLFLEPEEGNGKTIKNN